MKLCYYHIKLFKIVGNHSHTVILVTIVISLVFRLEKKNEETEV